MRITVYDAEYDTNEHDAKDAQVIDLGIVVIIGHDDKPSHLYAPGAWREVEFDRGE